MVTGVPRAGTLRATDGIILGDAMLDPGTA
jgi:hypothetical protein